MPKRASIGVSILILSAAIVLIGCRPVVRDNVRYRRFETRTIEAPSDRAIAAAQQVIVNRKLNIISAKTTDLDAQFNITSALGTRMIIYVVARDQAFTRIVLMLGGRRDEALASIVLNEIEDLASTPKIED